MGAEIHEFPPPPHGPAIAEVALMEAILALWDTPLRAGVALIWPTSGLPAELLDHVSGEIIVDVCARANKALRPIIFDRNIIVEPSQHSPLANHAVLIDNVVTALFELSLALHLSAYRHERDVQAAARVGAPCQASAAAPPPPGLRDIIPPR